MTAPNSPNEDLNAAGGAPAFGALTDDAPARLITLVYDELKRVALHHARRERADHTLQGTALVNEVFIRLHEHNAVPWNDRAHFFRLASQVMRHILVDHARARSAQKRGGDVVITSLDQTAVDYHEQCARQLYDVDESAEQSAQIELDFVALDAALEKLRALSPRQAQVIELRFFGGLGLDDTGESLGISSATVKRDWTMAKLFLKRELDLARQESE